MEEPWNLGAALEDEQTIQEKLNRLKLSLFQILPDMTSIVSNWQSLSKKEELEEKLNKDKKGKTPKTPEDKTAPESLGNTTTHSYLVHLIHSSISVTGCNPSLLLCIPPAADPAEVIMLKALLLQVMCLYQKVAPHLVSLCKFDFSKLFRGELFLDFIDIFMEHFL